MATTYPGTLDTFTNPVGTNTLDDPDHAAQHADNNDATEAIQAVIGTTAGTNVLKDFAAGQFPARVNAGGTIVQTLVGGTIDTSTFGTPTVVGGTFTSPTINTATIGTPTVTGGTFASPTTTGADAGTATLTNKTIDTASNTLTVVASDVSDFDTEVSNNTDVAANTTHRTSTGADHTYIDQSVVSGASPTFTNANFTEATDKNYVTDAEAVVIGNTSGTNTGDQDLSSYVTLAGTQTLTNKTLNGAVIGTSTMTGGTINTVTLGTPTLITPTIQNFDGWQAANETWTYASADDPTYTFTVPSDVTSKYSAGMRVKLTDGGTQYFIVTGVAESSGTTTMTIYGGTDYDLSGSAITNPYYSPMKAPQGFPLDPDKWSVSVSNGSSLDQSSPTQNTWYNLGSLSLDIPLGAWEVKYNVELRIAAAAEGAAMFCSLSTSNNSESDTTQTNGLVSGVATDICFIEQSQNLNLATKDTYYLIGRTTSSGVTTISFRGSFKATKIQANCAYL